MTSRVAREEQKERAARRIRGRLGGRAGYVCRCRPPSPSLGALSEACVTRQTRPPSRSCAPQVSRTSPRSSRAALSSEPPSSALPRCKALRSLAVCCAAWRFPAIYSTRLPLYLRRGPGRTLPCVRGPLGRGRRLRCAPTSRPGCSRLPRPSPSHFPPLDTNRAPSRLTRERCRTSNLACASPLSSLCPARTPPDEHVPQHLATPTPSRLPPGLPGHPALGPIDGRSSQAGPAPAAPPCPPPAGAPLGHSRGARSAQGRYPRALALCRARKDRDGSCPAQQCVLAVLARLGLRR